MKEILKLSSDEQGAFFDSLRKEYPIRREFSNYKVILDESYPQYQRLESTLGILGFNT